MPSYDDIVAARRAQMGSDAEMTSAAIEAMAVVASAVISARLAQKFTVADLARLSGLPVSTVRRIERGAGWATADELRALAAALGQNIDLTGRSAPEHAAEDAEDAAAEAELQDAACDEHYREHPDARPTRQMLDQALQEQGVVDADEREQALRDAADRGHLAPEPDADST